MFEEKPRTFFFSLFNNFIGEKNRNATFLSGYVTDLFNLSGSTISLIVKKHLKVNTDKITENFSYCIDRIHELSIKMDESWIEAVLKKVDYDNRLIKVLDIEDSSGGGKGENFFSRISKLKITTLLGSGKKKTVHCIVKRRLDQGIANRYERKLNLFKMEIIIYSTILNEMENLLDEFGDTRGKIWPDLIGYKPYDVIVFQDLTPEGYLMGDKTKGLDLDHGLLVIEGLARIHALSRILIDRGFIGKSDLNTHFVGDKEIFQKFWLDSLLPMSEEVQKWGGEWKSIGQKLYQFVKTKAADLMEEVYEQDESRFNVFNHGDSWNCNLLFKYDIESGTKKPISMKFIDFQVCHYNTVGWDLTYFLCSSLIPSTRRENLDTLLNKYVQVLNTSLDLYRYDGPRMDIEALKSEMKRIQVFSLMILCGTQPIFFSDLKDAFEFDRMDTDGEYPISMELYRGKRGEQFKNYIGPDLKKFAEDGFI